MNVHSNGGTIIAVDNGWWLLGPGIGGFAVALGVLGFGMLRRRQAVVLTGTVLLAMGALLLVGGGLLVADPKAGLTEALKTGGLGAGSVVALYALWLNDRRRQVEEQRQRLDTSRAEHDRERVSDERFAKAVELLGHEADQVRVGALHALAGIARSRPEYAQTVLDIYCAYLRRPFEMPDERKGESRYSREGEVRRSAQQLIRDLLPKAGTDGPRYNLDLMGATLSRLDLSGRLVGGMRIQDATLWRVTHLDHAEFHGNVYLTRATFMGPLNWDGARFHRRVGLGGVTWAQRPDPAKATFATPDQPCG
ncbi:pentapeptide repeat-containing protein [Crossiella sp. CA198]|uniref:pentapeptide repeat-containing protein n=1 Tax=Crossiella sp. CA198 TaxID=3455607 RepID=UPI003F8CF502